MSDVANKADAPEVGKLRRRIKPAADENVDPITPVSSQPASKPRRRTTKPVALVQLNVKLTQELRGKLDDYADENGLSIREAVELAISRL